MFKFIKNMLLKEETAQNTLNLGRRIAAHERLGRRGICVKCGSVKSGSLVACPQCGFQPVSDSDLILSLGLNENHLRDNFLPLAKAIKFGKKPVFSPQDMNKLAESLAVTKRMLPLDNKIFMLQDSYENLFLASTLRALETTDASLYKIAALNRELCQGIVQMVILVFCMFCYEALIMRLTQQPGLGYDDIRRLHAYTERAFPYRVTNAVLNSDFRWKMFNGSEDQISEALPRIYRENSGMYLELLNDEFWPMDNKILDMAASELCFFGNNDLLKLYQLSCAGFFFRIFESVQSTDERPWNG